MLYNIFIEKENVIMDENYLKRLKLAMEIAEKTISSALLITKVLANDSLSSLEKAYIANTIAERTRHEIAMISNRDYFNKEDLFNIEKIKAEIERLTNDE